MWPMECRNLLKSTEDLEEYFKDNQSEELMNNIIKNTKRYLELFSA